MSYHYTAKTDAEIEQTAAIRALKLKLLSRDALRRLFPES